MSNENPSARRLNVFAPWRGARRGLLAGVSLPAALILSLQIAQAGTNPVGGKGGADPLDGQLGGGEGGTVSNPDAPELSGFPSSEGGGGGGQGGLGRQGGSDSVRGFGGDGGNGGTAGYTGATLPTSQVSGTNGGNGGDGVLGTNGTTTGGGGGGAGGNGAVITGPVDGAISVDITGGRGGNGGRAGVSANPAAQLTGNGGGGGDGGVGLSFSGSRIQIDSRITGGNGGLGGGSGASQNNGSGVAGAGGDGGDGIVSNNSTIIIGTTGQVKGGDGGGGGDPVSYGASGAGVSGSGLIITVTSGGSITGGLDGRGAQGLALDLTGSNRLGLAGGAILVGGINTTGQLEIVAQSPLVPGGAVNLANVISGNGSVRVFGTDTPLQLSGQNTYTGGTFIEAKTIISNDWNLGDATGGVTLDNGGTLAVSGNVTSGRVVTFASGGGVIETSQNNDSLTLTGTLTGPGAYSKTGDGTLTLSGTSNYTGATYIDAGVLKAGAANAFSATSFHYLFNATLDLNNHDQTIGSLGGVGDVTLGSGKLTTGGDNSSTVYAGVISGTGGLTKTGSGNFVLYGANTYTGLTTISGGTLSVNGSLAGGVLLAGGALGGTGSVGSVTVGAGGALAPGNSIGTITVNGNLAFAPGSFYRVEVSPTDADRTNVTGSASLTGASVQTLFAPGSYVSRSYTILSAAGGLGGTTFSGVSAPAGFITSLSYSPTDVTLNLTAGLGRNDLLTFNQRSAAGAINAIFNTGGVVPGGIGLFLLSGTSLGAGLDSLSGEVHASTATALQEESAYVRGAVLGRLRQTGGATGSDGQMMALAPNEATPTTGVTAKGPIAPRLSSVAFWAQGFGAWGRVGSDLNAATLHRDAAGFMSGMDAKLGDFGRAGVAAGYTNSQNRLDARGFANIETANVSAYGGAGLGPIDLRLGAAYSFHSIRTDRTIAFPGFMDRASASYGGGTAQVFGEAGYRFKIANVSVEPFAGGAFVHVNTDNAVEQAMAAGLTVSGTSFDVGYSNVGARFWTALDTGAGTKLLPRASFAWRHAFSGLAPYGVMAFATAPGGSFATFGVPIARDALLAEGGFDLAITRNATIGVSYAGQISDRVQDHAARGRLSWSF